VAERFIKDPSATLDYKIDWTQWLVVGDTISTSTWSVPTGITKDTDTTNTTYTTIWLSGGTDGTKYTITNHVTTNTGRVDERSITIEVKNR
jgi:hypothetical protein